MSFRVLVSQSYEITLEVSGSELAAQAVISFGEGLSLLSFWDLSWAIQLGEFTCNYLDR